MTYRIDGRTTGQLLTWLALHGAGTPLPAHLRLELDEAISDALAAGSLAGVVPAPMAARLAGAPSWRPATWADLLFAGDVPIDPSEASQALLAELAAEVAATADGTPESGDAGSPAHRTVLDHLNALPLAARVWFHEQRLAIPRLAAAGDRVYLVAEADPGRVTLEIPAGSAVLAGKNALGGDRVYRTSNPLSVLAPQVAGLMGQRGDAAPGAELAVAEVPVGGAGLLDEANPPATHELYLFSPLLAFAGGVLEVIVRFPDQGPAAPVAALDWWFSSVDADGAPAEAVAGAVAYSGAGGGRSVVLALQGACGPGIAHGRTGCYLRAAPKPGAAGAAAFDLAGGAPLITAVRSSGQLPAQRAWYGTGLLDTSKEFQPFGPIPRRGDSFVLQSDEAFGKPLADLKIHMTMFDPADGSAWLLQQVEYTPYQHTWAVSPPIPDPAKINWQTHTSGGWANRVPKDDLTEADFGTLDSTLPASEAITYAGVDGHFVRAFLSGGDFGWDEYQTNVARFAHEIAVPPMSGVSVSADDLVPPDPPTLSELSISYTTHPQAPEAILVRNGRTLSWRADATLPFDRTPFADLVPGHTGAVYLGLHLAPSVLGSILALLVDVDPGPACSAVPDAQPEAWAYWDGGGWQPLDVIDSTSSLRQTGIVRVLTPTDWATGGVVAPPVEDEEPPAARWVRMTTQRPDSIGRILGVYPDAVTATYELAYEDDPTPLTPLQAGEAKLLQRPIAGIRKVTNPLPSVGGRPPEPDLAYVARAGQVVRHRNRAVNAADFEELVRVEFPEVALVRCLPHTSPTSDRAPGWVSLVVVPRTTDPQPLPSVGLAERIETRLGPIITPHAKLAILCPCYVAVGVAATIQLLPGVGASSARLELEAHLDGYLHPINEETGEVRLGTGLFASSVVAELERHELVDYVVTFDFTPPHAGRERIAVDPQRGAIASSAAHSLVLRETLA